MVRVTKISKSTKPKSIKKSIKKPSLRKNLPKKNKSNFDSVIKDICSLFNDYGEADYIGEPVSLIEHSLQAANEAAKSVKKSGRKDDELILGSLFHDLGHIIAIADEERGIRVV